VTQVWFADDAAAGPLCGLLEWQEQLCSFGTGYSYHVNASKSWLIVKEQYYDEACHLFGSNSLNITMEGRPYLGAPLGSPNYTSKFLQEKVCLSVSDELTYVTFLTCHQPTSCRLLCFDTWLNILLD